MHGGGLWKEEKMREEEEGVEQGRRRLAGRGILLFPGRGTMDVEGYELRFRNGKVRVSFFTLSIFIREPFP